MSEYEIWTRDEVAEWPGASVRYEARAKHNSAIISFGGQERFVVLPSTPSDNGRGLYNHLADVRRTLRDMGAKRKVKPRRTAPKRERNPGAAKRVRSVGDKAPVRPDPWAGLRGLTVPAPVPPPVKRPSLFRAFLAAILFGAGIAVIAFGLMMVGWL